jgi:CheY-like chemotaxis protein
MFHLNVIGQVAFTPANPARESAPLRIMIVEDDEADAYLIKKLLTEHPRTGQVIRAVDGVEALEMLAVGLIPDLAFIDLKMPRMNGFTLVQEIDSRRLRFPMVVLTSSAAQSDLSKRRLGRAEKILTKPVAVSQMRVLLDKAIDSVET